MRQGISSTRRRRPAAEPIAALEVVDADCGVEVVKGGLGSSEGTMSGHHLDDNYEHCTKLGAAALDRTLDGWWERVSGVRLDMTCGVFDPFDPEAEDPAGEHVACACVLAQIFGRFSVGLRVLLRQEPVGPRTQDSQQWEWAIRYGFGLPDDGRGRRKDHERLAAAWRRRLAERQQAHCDGGGSVERGHGDDHVLTPDGGGAR